MTRKELETLEAMIREKRWDGDGLTLGERGYEYMKAERDRALADLEELADRLRCAEEVVQQADQILGGLR